MGSESSCLVDRKVDAKTGASVKQPSKTPSDAHPSSASEPAVHDGWKEGAERGSSLPHIWPGNSK
ncbi:hypothetical protein RvY_03387 [Ramazzottius varieornatus]|uniref:Uncharacterized protein n=1 Tax=Ramazzottius varieornatus TaxID=947166 RepID=A0A1D1UNP2_RAMVA|nr:hypothetical protein RvY_03387 [Ramazzottius varieornatus]